MLLPTKGVSSERALLTLGSKILSDLAEPASISAVWERFRAANGSSDGEVSFDWFALALTSLYAMELVDWSVDGRLVKIDVR